MLTCVICPSYPLLRWVRCSYVYLSGGRGSGNVAAVAVERGLPSIVLFTAVPCVWYAPHRTGYQRQLKGCPFSPAIRMPPSSTAAATAAGASLARACRVCHVRFALSLSLSCHFDCERVNAWCAHVFWAVIWLVFSSACVCVGGYLCVRQWCLAAAGPVLALVLALVLPRPWTASCPGRIVETSLGSLAPLPPPLGPVLEAPCRQSGTPR